ncbi:MAG: enoyl-CoA hydratase/isomerase family protein [Deltaproteobacteria bacterium]|nr:enoyl-CoA hydratase/isomerase family protein [Deltaproteobacteria bacterium]
MSYQHIIYEKRRQAGWITLNRGKDMNSLSGLMLTELTEVLVVAEKDDEVRVLVLTGKGKAFCAGADLKEVLAGFGQKKGTAPDFLDKAQVAMNKLRHFSKPVIGALNGLTLAGGLELAMCCDVIIAAESAKIGDAHSNYGLFPGGGGAAILSRKIGLNRAKYLSFTGDIISASEMMEYGFINLVVPDGELEKTVETLIKKLAAKSPLGLKLMKQVANQSLDQTVEAALQIELLTLREYMRSYDVEEGLKAFQEKRKPEFKGY